MQSPTSEKTEERQTHYHLSIAYKYVSEAQRPEEKQRDMQVLFYSTNVHFHLASLCH